MARIKREKKGGKSRVKPAVRKKPRRKTKPRRRKAAEYQPNIVRIGEGSWEESPHAWHIENMLARNGTGVFAALEKTGKTWFLLEMIISVVSGIPFLGKYVVHKTGPALIYSPELEPPELEGRIAEICGIRGLDPKTLNIHIDAGRFLRLELEDNQKKIAMSITRIRPALVIFDPLNRCYQGGLNSEKKLMLMINFLESIAREHDCSVLLAHHSAKKHPDRFGGKGSGVLSAFGSSNFKAVSIGEPEDMRSKLVTQQRRGAPVTLYLRLAGEESEKNRHIVIETLDEISAERKICEAERTERAMLEYARLNGPVSFNQIDAAIPGRRITKLRLLQGLKKTRAMVETDDEKWVWCMNVVVPVPPPLLGDIKGNGGAYPALGAVPDDFCGGKNNAVGEASPVPALAAENAPFLTCHETAKPAPVLVEKANNTQNNREVGVGWEPLQQTKTKETEL